MKKEDIEVGCWYRYKSWLIPDNDEWFKVVEIVDNGMRVYWDKAEKYAYQNYGMLMAVDGGAGERESKLLNMRMVK